MSVSDKKQVFAVRAGGGLEMEMSATIRVFLRLPKNNNVFIYLLVLNIRSYPPPPPPSPSPSRKYCFFTASLIDCTLVGIIYFCQFRLSKI